MENKPKILSVEEAFGEESLKESEVLNWFVEGGLILKNREWVEGVPVLVICDKEIRRAFSYGKDYKPMQYPSFAILYDVVKCQGYQIKIEIGGNYDLISINKSNDRAVLSRAKIEYGQTKTFASPSENIFPLTPEEFAKVLEISEIK